MFEQVRHENRIRSHIFEINIFSVNQTCHRQTYQNYEQSQQKFDTFLDNKEF